MKRIVFLATALLIASATSALADDVAACDESSITMVADAIVAGTDPEHPDRAQTGNMELETAKQAMKEGRTEDCLMHLNMAMQALNQK